MPAARSRPRTAHLGYPAALLSLGALRNAAVDELIDHARASAK